MCERVRMESPLQEGARCECSENDVLTMCRCREEALLVTFQSGVVPSPSRLLGRLEESLC